MFVIGESKMVRQKTPERETNHSSLSHFDTPPTHTHTPLAPLSLTIHSAFCFKTSLEARFFLFTSTHHPTCGTFLDSDPSCFLV